MYSDFNNCRASTNFVAETQEVTDKTANAPSQAKTIMIFAAGKDKAINDSAVAVDQQCRAAKVSSYHVAVGDASRLPAMISILRSNGTIGDESQVFLDLHGGLCKDKNGKVDLELAPAMDSDDAGSTLEVLHALRKPLDGGAKACSATVFITACHSGAQEFVNRVQELHNSYTAGVCFLLSSKAIALAAAGDAAMKTVCDEFISAKRCGGAPPTSEHLWALLTSHAIDCVSMVVANEAHPRRVHGTEAMIDGGPEAMIDRLDRSALVFLDDKKTCLGLNTVENGPFEEHAQIPKRKDKHYTISGDLSGLKASKASLEALKGTERKTELSHTRFLYTISRSADRETLSDYINGTASLASLKGNFRSGGTSWTKAHSLVVSFLIMASYDENKQRRDEKLEYLGGLIHSGLQQSNQHPLVLQRLLPPKVSRDVFSKLIRMGLFIKHGGDPLGRIRPICLDMAKRPGGLAHLKDIFAIVPEDIFPAPNPDRGHVKDRRTFGEILITMLASENPQSAAARKFLSEVQSSAIGDRETVQYLGNFEIKASEIRTERKRIEAEAKQKIAETERLVRMNRLADLLKSATESETGALLEKLSDYSESAESSEDFMIDVLMSAYKDVVPARRKEKIDLVSKRISLNSAEQIKQAAKNVFAESPHLFRELNKAGFFLMEGGKVYAKIGVTAAFLVQNSDLQTLKDLVGLKFEFDDENTYPPVTTSRTADEIWIKELSDDRPAPVEFFLKLLQLADKNPNEQNRKEITDYIMEVICDPKCAGAFQNRSDHIWGKYPQLCERLSAASIIGPKPKESSSDSDSTDED